MDSALQHLRAVAEALRALGIAVVVGCLPSKASVIGEEQAGDLAARSAWLTALTEAQHDIDGIELFDLLPALRAARRHGMLYDRVSLDLNGLGAFFAVRALLKEVAKQCPAVGALQLSELHLSTEPEGELVPAWHRAESVTDAGGGAFGHESGDACPSLYVREDFPSDVRLAFVAEPDALGLLPWLAECARRTTYFCAPTPPMAQLELEMPDARDPDAHARIELHTLAGDDDRSGSPTCYRGREPGTGERRGRAQRSHRSRCRLGLARVRRSSSSRDSVTWRECMVVEHQLSPELAASPPFLRIGQEPVDQLLELSAGSDR